jgi:hypothetical protein
VKKRKVNRENSNRQCLSIHQGKVSRRRERSMNTASVKGACRVTGCEEDSVTKFRMMVLEEVIRGCVREREGERGMGSVLRETVFSSDAYVWASV